MISRALVGKFNSIAQRYKDNTALVETNGSTFSYFELATRALSISNILRSLNIQTGHKVALLQYKSCEHIANILAILSCDAVVVPLDPSLPAERIAQILHDLHPNFIIADNEIIAASRIHISTQSTRVSLTDKSTLVHVHEDACSFENLAYILFTSGSTGSPKGVCIPHTAIESFINWASVTVPLISTDRVASIAPAHFDLSLYDIFATLTSGATLYLHDVVEIKNARQITKMLGENKITSIYATPSFLMAVLQFGKPDHYDWSAIRQVLFAGEIFPVKHLHELMAKWTNARYFNLYGPTETNVCAWYEVAHADNLREKPYPIGQLCAGLHSEITAEGELIIGGPHVALGYLNSEDLTSAKFFNRDGQRWFRTGDIVTSDEQGMLLYSGRVDRMMKRRGFRIEPIEIEIALQRHAEILASAVTSNITAEGEIQIIAWIVCRAPYKPDVIALKSFLAEILADYMIPDRIIAMESFPKTTSGKTDYTKLKQSLSSDIPQTPLP